MTHTVLPRNQPVRKSLRPTMEIVSFLAAAFAVISLIATTLAHKTTIILPTQCEIHPFIDFDLYSLGISGNISVSTNPCKILEKAVSPSLAVAGPGIKFQCVRYSGNTMVAFFNTAKNDQAMEAILTQAFSGFAFDCKPGNNALIRYSDPPPAGCTVGVAEGHEDYGLTLPVQYSKTTCGRIHTALKEYMLIEAASICQPFEGLWTVIGFAGKNGAVEGVNRALSETFPEFEIKCELSGTGAAMASSSTASVPSTTTNLTTTLSSSATPMASPATCTVETRDGQASYNFTLPVEYKETTCNDVKTALVNDSCILDEQSWLCQRYQDTSTNGLFIGHQGVVEKVEKALGSWHAFGIQCTTIATATER